MQIKTHTSQNGHHQKNLQINAGEHVEKREPSCTAGGKCKLVQPLWKTVWRFLEKIRNETTTWSSPVLGIYPKSTKTLIEKETCTTMFIAALFTIARTWKQPNCPSTDEWIKKMWHIYTMGYYSAIKGNEIELFVEIGRASCRERV